MVMKTENFVSHPQFSSDLLILR